MSQLHFPWLAFPGLTDFLGFIYNVVLCSFPWHPSPFQTNLVLSAQATCCSVGEVSGDPGHHSALQDPYPLPEDVKQDREGRRSRWIEKLSSAASQKALQVPPRVLEECFSIPLFFRCTSSCTDYGIAMLAASGLEKTNGTKPSLKVCCWGAEQRLRPRQGMSGWGYIWIGWEKGQWGMYRGTTVWHPKRLTHSLGSPRVGLAFLGGRSC